ncbi:MAG: xanthine dehydrogenase family protein molybdopterin-binding subunit [Alphaproteobacteria bacterium]|nr:xanthine dehydrogenase family protein molybdopterin-binding subunit [Alphaproteobacteria bacterium]
MNPYIHPVGARLPRLETREKITGRAEYTDDLVRPGMLHAAILQSPHAHARIISYDTTRALAVPGVIGVITGDDAGWGRSGPFVKDETAIAKGKVRYVGEPVAAVAALDVDTARQAAQLIDVVYEELPAVFSPDEALAPNAPIIHEELATYVNVLGLPVRGNVLQDCEISQGNVDSAWGECDVIVEGEFETQAQYHAYMEPCAALAEVDANGKLTVWSSNQSIFRDQSNLSESLGLPMSKIRCLSPKVGGAFGGKIEITVQPIAAMLAIKTGKPVRIALTREQDMETMRVRHPARIRMKTGAKKDGTLVAREVDILMDVGAYADDSPGVVGVSTVFSRGTYRIPHARCRGKGVYTNKLRSGAFRGFGGPQAAWAGEQQIDEIAAKIGMDPLELRLKNAPEPGREWMCGIELERSDLKECLEKVRAASDWKRRRNEKGRPGFRRGIGLACIPHISGVLSSSAIIRILEDGSAVLSTGAVDNGQGSDTVLVQMAAESLGLPVDRITFAQPDTDASPYNWGTSASRVTYMVGRAIVGAAEEAVKKLIKYASQMMECAEVDLELRLGGFIGLKGVPDKVLPFAAISGYAHWAAGGPIIGTHALHYDGPVLDPTKAVIKHFPFRFGVWTFGVHAVEIEIDEATGRITPLAVWAAHDLGRAINPMAVEGQIEGGVVQGIGYALFEEMVWDGGKVANPSFMDYKIPGTMDSPMEIHSILVENPDGSGPFGAKGIGEPPIVGPAPAIANALFHATGVRLTKLPMTPERVLRALNEAPRAH